MNKIVQKKGTEKENEEERRPTDEMSILKNIVKQSNSIDSEKAFDSIH